MVAKLAGWLTYLPALPNWVFTSQNCIGGSSIMSITLEDHVFPVAWLSKCLKCPSCSMQTILYPGLHFKSHLPGCLFLKYTWSPIWKAGLSLPIVFWAVLNLFSSNVYFAIAKANLCVFSFSIPESGPLRKLCIGSSSWCKGGLGSLLYAKKNGISAIARFGVII